ncbi:hypothetical protein GJ496_007723 [Pomphorhynchus laevis]|nr:hypothetical protein GJ496_007723 [Pomphorhynchus laevis]
MNVVAKGKSANCKTAGGVYFAQCRECAAQYVGETKHPLKDRLTKRRHHIKIGLKADGAAAHTITEGSEHTFTYKLLDVDTNDCKRRQIEQRWIGRLHTDQPPGVNTDKHIFRWWDVP